MRSSKYLIPLGFVTAAFVGGTIFMYLAFSGPRNLPQNATLLPQALPLPEFSLLDHHTNPFDRESLTGQWTLLFFGFTHCPDICPATLQQLAIARTRTLRDTDAGFPRIVLVSIDPERDTPEVMKKYVEHFDAEVTGVTGRLEELRKLTAALGIYFEKSPGIDGNYSVDHSAVVIVVNPDAEFQALFRAPHKIEHFLDDLPGITASM
jgi:protein SCO1/2